MVSMHSEAPLISSAFSIEGKDFDPDECTKAIGIQPNEIGRIGEKLRPDSLGTLKISFWSISFIKEATYDLDEGLVKVLETMWPKREKILEYLRVGSFDNAAFSSTVNIYVDRPLYRIRPEVLRRFAFFGVEYIFDVHDYSE